VKKGWSQTENTMTWDLDAPSVYIIVEMGGIWNCIPRGVDCIAVVTPWLSLLPMAATIYGYP